MCWKSKMCLSLIQRRPKFLRYIQLKSGNIALSLQSATRKCLKLMVYWTKYYLFLPTFLFIATCDSFSFLSRDFFQFLDIVLCKVLNVTGDHLCHCIKNCVYSTFNLHHFICSMRESLCKSLNLFQVQI